MGDTKAEIILTYEGLASALGINGMAEITGVIQEQRDVAHRRVRLSITGDNLFRVYEGEVAPWISLEEIKNRNHD